MSGRYAWQLDNVRALAEPVPATGRQGLWVPSDELIEAVSATAQQTNGGPTP